MSSHTSTSHASKKPRFTPAVKETLKLLYSGAEESVQPNLLKLLQQELTEKQLIDVLEYKETNPEVGEFLSYLSSAAASSGWNFRLVTASFAYRLENALIPPSKPSSPHLLESSSPLSAPPVLSSAPPPKSESPPKPAERKGKAEKVDKAEKEAKAEKETKAEKAEKDEEKVMCSGKTKDGKPCRYSAQPGTNPPHCKVHTPK